MCLPPPARSQSSILVRVTELVEPILVLYPSSVSRVDLTGLASMQQPRKLEASKQGGGKQPTKQPAASTHEMGKNHSSIVVLRIRPKFWWMIAMSVRDSQTKYEPETQLWWPGTGIADAGSLFQNLKFGANISLFWPKSPNNLLKAAK